MGGRFSVDLKQKSVSNFVFLMDTGWMDGWFIFARECNAMFLKMLILGDYFFELYLLSLMLYHGWMGDIKFVKYLKVSYWN